MMMNRWDETVTPRLPAVTILFPAAMIRFKLAEKLSILIELMIKKNSSQRPKKVTDEVAAVVNVDFTAVVIVNITCS